MPKWPPYRVPCFPIQEEFVRPLPRALPLSISSLVKIKATVYWNYGTKNSFDWSYFKRERNSSFSRREVCILLRGGHIKGLYCLRGLFIKLNNFFPITYAFGCRTSLYIPPLSSFPTHVLQSAVAFAGLFRSSADLFAFFSHFFCFLFARIVYFFSRVLYLYWKCNFPMNPYVRLSVGWLVGRSFFRSVCHSFLKGREVKLPCSYCVYR